MKLIAAVDGAWHIGWENRTVYRLPQDLHAFRQITLGSAVVMGRKTFDSLAEGPLDGRVNLVLSRSMAEQTPGITVCRDLDQLRARLADFQDRPCWVIGGREIYRQLLPFCTHARITYTSRIYPADCSFPTPLPELGWVLEADEPVPDTYGVFRFQEYRNPAPEPF